MKSNVRFICPNCNHIEIEKLTFSKRLKRVPFKLIIGFLLFTSLIGTFGIYNFVMEGIYENPDLMVSTGGLWASMGNMVNSFQDKKEFKIIAENLTKDCDDDYCKSLELYNYILDNFEYEEGEKTLFPSSIYADKKGDCDELSYLYITLLKSIGINSRLSCANTHCWAIVKLENKNILADITGYEWRIYDN